MKRTKKRSQTQVNKQKKETSHSDTKRSNNVKQRLNENRKISINNTKRLK